MNPEKCFDIHHVILTGLQKDALKRKQKCQGAFLQILKWKSWQCSQQQLDTMQTKKS
jgi:hypothetical protein